MIHSAMVKLLVIAVVVGALASAAASIFNEVVAVGQKFLFTDLPAHYGLSQPPWWWVAILLLIGASIIVLARKLPGETGEGPLTGFHFDDPLSMVPSVLLAALATLIFGFALGPEAPLIVLGTAVGAILMRKAEPKVRAAVMLLGGGAAIGAVLGNPFITGFMLLEFSAIGMIPPMLIVPAFVALATGYLVELGVLGIPGFGTHSLAVPGLPDYSTVAPGDVAIGLLVAVVAGLVAVAVRELAVTFDKGAKKRVVLAIYVVAVVTALVVFITQVFFDIPVDQILFSGNSGMGQLVKQTSIVVVLVTMVGKGIAYAMALGGGMRGGPIFPATFLGVCVGVLGTLIFPFVPLSPMVAAGIAASAAGILRLPATSALLGAVLVTGTGPAIAPFAIFGAVIGLIIRMLVDKKLGNPLPPGPGGKPVDPNVLPA